MEKVALGGGCFWCTEAAFQDVDGIISVKPGYAGGEKENPTYQEVCSGTTGHAEVVQLEYDPVKIQFTKILELFFKVHDPTQSNRQGNDVGPQYRSIILYTKELQKVQSQDFIRNLQHEFDKPILTEIKKLEAFYPAEKYHENYYKNNRLNPYCIFVIKPKLDKVRKSS